MRICFSFQRRVYDLPVSVCSSVRSSLTKKDTLQPVLKHDCRGNKQKQMASGFLAPELPSFQKHVEILVKQEHMKNFIGMESFITVRPQNGESRFPKWM